MQLHYQGLARGYHCPVTLARLWTRQLFGASGAALLVPGAIAAALVVLAFAGGFGRLSSLGQVLSGPSLPGVTPVGVNLGGDGRSALGRALAAAATPTGTARGLTVSGGSTGPGAQAGPGSAAGTAGPGRGGSGSGGAGSGGSGSGGSGSGGSGSGGSGSGSGGPGSGGSGSGAGSGSPPPTPAPPTLVDGVVGVGTSLTAKIPGPVGTVATQTLQSVGTTLDRVLPLAGSGASAAPAAKPGLQLP
jgi:hypothetical protein